MSKQYGTLTVTLALMACSNSAPTPALLLASADHLETSVARHAAILHRDNRQSWFSAKRSAAGSSVLFVSDPGTGDVYMYSLPSLESIGTITGFYQPQGECSDSKGNVWVTDSNSRTIYELSHHGRLENEITDNTGYPVACAWDKSTGNLAVMNLFGLTSESGEVLVYPHGSGEPTAYQNSNQYFYNFGDYDSAGNLFFDGRDANGAFMLSELPTGAGSASSVKVTGGTIYFPGMVQWNAAKKQLIVGDQSCGNVYQSCVYSLKVTKSSATIAGETQLQDSGGNPICDLVQGVQFGKRLAGSDDDFCSNAPGTTYVWRYPAGGAPARENSAPNSSPVGAAVSK
jgi:hypothetical protein